MEPLHLVLTIACPDCNVRLVRVAQTDYQDFAICPGCMAAGIYESVIDDPAELAADFVLPDAVKALVLRLDRT